jgi:tetratricopeptide (TPR) repeat protein
LKAPPPSPAPAGTATVKTLGMGALVVCATILAYLPSFSGALIWNDSDYVTAPALRSLRGLALIWTKPGATQQYYPLLHSAFWVQHRLWGDNPLGYHVVTVMLHAAGAVLLALVLQRLFTVGTTRRYAGAEWIAALLFALHPVHVESVAWIAEQKNTLSLALYLGAALLYLDFEETRKSGAYIAALALFAASLLSKTVTATLPAALLVVAWWRQGRIEWKRDVVPLIPWLALGAVLGLFSGWVEKTYVGAHGSDFDVSAIGRVLVAGRAIWFYTANLAWPIGLNFIYPKWAIDPGIWWQWLYPAAAAAVAIVLWSLRSRSRGPLAAYLIFVGSLFPALGFVTLYGARYSWVWDHWQYLPDISLIALASAALVSVWGRTPLGVRSAGPAFVIVAAVVFGALSWTHCGMFHDNETLYTQTLLRNPGSWMAHNNLGLAWSKQPGRLDDAIAQYQEAVRLKPDVAETHTNLGSALAQIPGRTADAMAEYQEALRVEPDYSDAHFYLANALVQTGQVPEAIAQYKEALRIEPGLAEANNNLGMVLCRTGQTQEGLGYIDAAIRLEPGFAPAHFARGVALLQSGRRDEGVAELKRVLELQPGNPQATRVLQMVAGSP